MSEPQTGAGRTLLRDEMWERLYLALGGQSAVPEDMFAEAILAIEAEARDAALDALEAEVEALPQKYNNGLPRLISRAAVLEAIQQQRGPTND